MEITQVKEVSGGYKVNNQFFIPNDDLENKDYKDIQNWIIDGGIVEPEFTEEELLIKTRDRKISLIKSRKRDSLYLPVEYNGSTFINTEIAGSNLQAAYNFMDEPITWLDIEGNQVILTKAQIKELVGVMLTHRSSIYFQEAALIHQVNAIVPNETKTMQECIEEVEAINITFN